MSIDNDDIDKLFSDNFKTFDVPSPERGWEVVASKFKRAMFWRFRFNGFNVYYLSALITGAGVLVWLGVSGIKQTKEVPKFQDSVQTHKEIEKVQFPTITIDSVLRKQTVKPEVNHNKVIKIAPEVREGEHIEKPKNDSISGNPAIETEDKVTEKSLKPETTDPIIDTIKPKNKRVVKRVKIIKPSSIVNRDTIHLLKPKKKNDN